MSLGRKRRKNKNFGNITASAQNNNTSYPMQRPSSSEMLVQMNRKLIFESPAPFISASSWIIIDKMNGEVMFAKNENEPR